MSPLRRQGAPTNLESLFLANGKQETIPRGEVLHSTDDRPVIILVNSGYIKRYMITAHGNQSIQSIYGNMNAFPLTFVMKEIFNKSLYDGPETFFYETMTETEIYKLDGDILLGAIERDAELYRDLLSIAGDRLHSNIQRLENMSFSTSYHRTAHQLLFYARAFGEDTSQGRRILLPLTHSELANSLNIARETVSREIVKLRDAKLIFADSNQEIVIPDMQKLADVIYSQE